MTHREYLDFAYRFRVNLLTEAPKGYVSILYKNTFRNCSKIKQFELFNMP